MWPSDKRIASLESTDQQEIPALSNKKLRSACDRCHHSKMKCSGGMPCTACFNSRENCCYSVSNRSGRPKGAKNKRNHEQMSITQQDELPSPSAKSATQSSKPSQQFSQHIQQPMTPLTPSIDNLSFSPDSSTFWEPLHLDADDFMKDFQMSTSTNEPKDTSYDTASLFKSFTMDSSVGLSPILTDQSIYDIPVDSVDRQLPPGSPAASNTTRSTSVESEELFSNNQLYMPSSASISRTRTLTSPPPCHCLKQHSKLLCHLKNLEQQQHTASTLDVILSAVQHCLETWHNLIHCRVCPYDDDQTVLLLSVMTMRSMLCRFQRLCFPNGERHSPSDFPSPALGMVSLGSYEATKNEQTLVADLLIVRALGKIKHALLSLKEKTDHSSGQKVGADITDEDHQHLARPQVDVDCVQQLLHSLDGTVQAVKNAAERKDHVALEVFGTGIDDR